MRGFGFHAGVGGFAKHALVEVAQQRGQAVAPREDGRALCLSKDIIETRAFDEGNCNNFAVASSKEYLNGAYLDNLLEDVNGPNAFLTTELDLTTDDGLKDYGTCTVTIFLLTVDQYRRNRDVIPNADDWWWLSTAFSTKSNGYESLARLVFTADSDALITKGLIALLIRVLSGHTPQEILDADLYFIEKIGLPNYLQSKMGEPA